MTIPSAKLYADYKSTVKINERRALATFRKNSGNPLTRRIEFAFQPVRMARTLLVSFGALALFLSAVGLYGALAFGVSPAHA